MNGMFDLTGQVAAITGATRGIGRAMALALAHAGADIALLQRNPDNTAVKREVEALGRSCAIIACDLDNEAELRNAVPAVLSHFNRLDILVNNAGIQRRYPAVDFPEEAWDEVLRVNLRSVWILSQQAGRHMVEQQKGKIINIASITSFQGGITIPAYAAAKGGVAQLTKALSNEWAKHNVNVNAIAPGYIDTDLNVALINDPVRSRQILERIPAGRWGVPDDFTGSVVFLASAASNYVHGHLLAVDGGWLGR